MGNNIATQQDDLEFITRLAAQRRLYSIAKNIFATQFALSASVVFFAILFPQLSLAATVFILIFGLLGSTTFPLTISKYKEKAASIQEEIDCKLLKIPWHNDLVSTPCVWDIQKYSQKLLNNDKKKKKLFNWYEDIPGDLTYSSARIICQRYNLMWDIDLRMAFSLLVKIVAAFIVLVVAYANKNVVGEKIILNIIVPACPIIVFTLKQHIDNKNAVEKMKDLKIQLDLLWNDLLSFKYSDKELESRSRSVQDMIFWYRKGNPLIPDWFSFINNERQQNIASNTVLHLTRQYRSALEQNG